MPTAVQDNVTGERLAAARRSAGLSQRGLAERLGVPIWGVEQMERGAADPSPYLSEISSLTGQPLNYFLAPAPRQAQEEELVVDAGEDAGEMLPRRFIVLGALTVLMTIRFFSETIKVFPKYFSLIDIPVFVFIVLFAVSARTWRPAPAPLRAIAVLGVAFMGICGLSVMVNLSRIEAAPAMVFIYTVIGPIAWAFAIHRLWPGGNAPLVMRWIFGLGLAQLFAVVFFGLPRFFISNNPDYISGTFGENGYQLVFFLFVSIAALAAVLTYDRKRPIARFAVPMIAAYSIIIFLVQYRSLLATMALSLLLIGYFLRGRARGILVGGVVAISLVTALYVIASNFQELKYQQVQDITEESGAMVFINARLGVASDVTSLYGDNPRFVLTGSGPGTFSSRAWRTFGVLENAKKSTAGTFVNRLTGGEPYRTDVSDRYTVPRARAQEVIGGSVLLTQPFASYTALAAETGMGGLVAIGAIYLLAFLWGARMTQQAIANRLHSDPIVPIALAATVAMFVLIQLGALENWLEVTRITFFGWALLAITAKEIETRQNA